MIGEDQESETDSQFGDFVPENRHQPKMSNTERNHISINLNSSSGKAPTMVIEAVHVGKPQKVVAFLANIGAFLLFLTSFVSTAWMQTRGIRMGLFHECIKLEDDWVLSEFKRLQLPLPKTACGMSECISSLMKICGAFNLFSLIVCAITLILMGYGMSTVVISRKFITYNIVIGLNCVSMAIMLASMVMYPIFFYIQFAFEGEEIHHHPHGGNVQIGWSLIAATIGIVLLSFQTFLMAIDKSGEEIVYRERILRDDADEFEEI